MPKFVNHMAERNKAPFPGDGRPRIQSLDGLRAFSILAVIVAHATTAALRGSSPVPGWAWLPQSLGLMGVTVFFGISGFIITTLLLREHAATGHIDLRGFYVRRAFRILPAYWVFLTVMAFAIPALPLDRIGLCFAFLTDIFPTRLWWLDHSWSLSVEEQFYLAWPVTFALLGPQRSLRAVSGLVISYPVVRVALQFLVLDGHGKDFGVMHLRFDAIAFGCLVALLRGIQPAHFILRFMKAPAVAISAIIFLTVVSPTLMHAFPSPYCDYIVGAGASSVAVGSLIVCAIENPDSLVGRILNARAVVHVGILSYSLYLWQQPFFAATLDGFLGLTPVRLLAALLAAEASYRLVEHPMLRLRAWLSRRRVHEHSGPSANTPGRPAVDT